jgi:predicted transcriptional regulator
MSVTELEQRQQEKMNRAGLAKQVLDNPMYREAFIVIKSTLVEQMEKVKTKDVAELQEITRTLQNLNRLEKTLKRVYEGGKVIEKKRFFSKP